MPINLHDFCGDWRRTIDKPFSRGEHTYATDGRIVIRVPRREDVEENEKAPHAERVWPKEPATEFAALKHQQLPDPAYVKCDVCGGRGTEHDCPDCSCTCSECAGSGELRTIAAVKIGDADMNDKYARLLMTLPDVRVARPIEGRMEFRFDGGEGLVMLLRQGHHKDVIADMTPDEWR